MADIWTLEALKQHIDQRFDDEARAISLASRVTDAKIESLSDDVNALQVWQWKIVGAVAISAFVIPVIVGTVVYLLTIH